MYFLAGGQVDIDLNGNHILLAVRHFFDDIAVLRRALRSATFAAANLLVLDASENAVVRNPVGSEVVSPRGGSRRAQSIDERAIAGAARRCCGMRRF
jgi:hypothetical protein